MAISVNQSVSGVYTGPVVQVAPATGVPTSDAAAIRAALTAAGSNGSVIFPVNQTYVVGGKGGQVVFIGALPALIDLNGCTIQVTSTVTAATTSNTVANGATTVPLQSGNGSLFQAGDYVSIHASTYASTTYAGTVAISSVSTDTLNISALTYDNGTTTASGAFVQHDNAALFLQDTVSTLTGVRKVKICNGTLDGNVTARLANGVRQAWPSQSLLHVIQASLHIDNMIFKDAPADAVLLAGVPFFKATDCHFENVYGNGLHMGGSTTATRDVIVSNNSFKNVQQWTGGTTPTINQYGHTYQTGAIVTSSGPTRAVISGNVVDTSRGWGFAAVDSVDNDFAITGNVFYACDSGAFNVYTGGKNCVISGNMINTCGHDRSVSYTSAEEQTQILGTSGGSTVSNTTITGNTFIDSTLILANDVTDVTISGNTFSLQNLTNTSGSTNTSMVAAIYVNFSSGGAKRVSITGNTITLPINTSNALNGIMVTNGTDISVASNVVVGGRMGIWLQGATLLNVLVANNTVSNQCVSTGGTTPSSLNLQLGNAAKGITVVGNNISMTQTCGTSWYGMTCFANSVTSGELSVTENKVTVIVRPTGGAVGIRMNQTAITWSGFQITFRGNTVTMNNASDLPFAVPATGATTVHYLLNRMLGTFSTPTFTGNTTTIGGGTDSNYYA